jgi:diadenosine tetraphosphate (Ap4A) HIT family hydrolase
VKNACLFCQFAEDKHQRPAIKKFKHCYAMNDGFPVSPGHTLIIPYIHVEDWFSASSEVRTDIMQALDSMKSELDQRFAPDGYNIGMNCGHAAGQTIFHLHVHLIPRYKGDLADPKGGVRCVIPDKQKY